MSDGPRKTQSLKDHFLVASPWLGDPNFQGGLVYICEHSEDGTFGLMINHPLDVSLGEILEQLDMDGGHLELPVYAGGPVEQERGFVLHPTDERWQSSTPINSELQVTTSRDILQAIGNDIGPEHFLVALGYSGWGAGQLEEELAGNAWLTCPASNAILFSTPWRERYRAVLASMGIDPGQLGSSVGHA
ncbi:putative transcriptional regulator [Marinobacter daqiaonensis]|uniref:UPF0301 protein SAMN05216203_1965 n=1 Tax=Marinobacter daqiaonensis TaxID=650891 RepID=A0A1I6I9J2_9GAMM|nr:YqgE/AlgH family protein [Marinobacter daqiaonensis]SFR63050.1 putative transcriptional regulator [Marinobacter daqiaonensis]